MGSLPVSAHRGHVPWQGLLLVVSLLSFWSPPTSAQFAIVSTCAAEGEDVRLYLRNTPPDVRSFEWFRGEGANRHRKIATHHIVKGGYNRHSIDDREERIPTKESLLLKKVTLYDSGMYTVVAHLRNSIKEIGFGRLEVYEPDILVTVIASNTTVTEDKDSVVLMCYSNAFSPRWLFGGFDLRLTERMKLSDKNRKLTIKPVKREDAGNYQCEVSNPVTSDISWPLELHVKYD